MRDSKIKIENHYLVMHEFGNNIIKLGLTEDISKATLFKKTEAQDIADMPTLYGIHNLLTPLGFEYSCAKWNKQPTIEII